MVNQSLRFADIPCICDGLDVKYDKVEDIVIYLFLRCLKGAPCLQRLGCRRK